MQLRGAASGQSSKLQRISHATLTEPDHAQNDWTKTGHGLMSGPEQGDTQLRSLR